MTCARCKAVQELLLCVDCIEILTKKSDYMRRWRLERRMGIERTRKTEYLWRGKWRKKAPADARACSFDSKGRK